MPPVRCSDKKEVKSEKREKGTRERRGGESASELVLKMFFKIQILASSSSAFPGSLRVSFMMIVRLLGGISVL